MPQHIDPGAIPGADLDPDSVDAEARRLATLGGAVEDQGATIQRTWQGLGVHYEAPESGQLFAVMSPVESRAATFGGNLETVASALSTYASEVRPIKAELDRLRTAASNFVANIRGGVEVSSIRAHSGTTSTRTVEWHEDQASVDQNNALIAQVNAQMVRLWEVERTCANAIYGVIGRASVEVASESNPDGYGVEAIPDGTEMPWGASVERSENCGEQAAGAVKGFVWDGIVVGGIWGTVEGLGTLVLGYNPQTGDWFSGDAYGAAWSNLGMLGVGLASVGPAGLALASQPGPVGDFVRRGQQTLVDTGKGLIAWDQWSEDPAAAAGASVFNIATIVVPAGAAITSVKAGSGAGAAAMRTAARTVDIIDPAALAFRGGSAAVRGSMPMLGDLSRLFDHSALSDLGDISRLTNPSIEVPTLPRDSLSLDAPPGGVLAEAPVRGTDSPAFDGPDGSPAPDAAPAPNGSLGPDAAPATDGAPAADASRGSDVPAAPLSDDAFAALSPEQQYSVAMSEVGTGARSFADDASATAYGREEWAGITDELSADARDALLDYTRELPGPSGITYAEINAALRSSDPIPADIAPHVARIDEALAARPFTEDVMVSRGTNVNHWGVSPQDAPGHIFTEDSYLSTSLGGPAPGFQGKDVTLHLRVPEGTPGMWVENVSAFGGAEREVLLGRGIQWEATRSVLIDGQWHVFGEVKR